MAFHIPEGQPDGVYSVQQLDNGTEVHTRIGNLPRTVRRRSSIGDDFSSDMPIYNVKCFPEEGLEDLDHGSTDIANAAVDSQCGSGAIVSNARAIYSISDCVVAYYCHLQSTMTRDLTCTAKDRRAASLEITGQCGRYKPGQALKMIQSTLDETYYKYVYGYESYCTPQGHDFCGLATAGD
jgi:hypothetical protein